MNQSRQCKCPLPLQHLHKAMVVLQQQQQTPLHVGFVPAPWWQCNARKELMSHGCARSILSTVSCDMRAHWNTQNALCHSTMHVDSARHRRVQCAHFRPCQWNGSEHIVQGSLDLVGAKQVHSKCTASAQHTQTLTFNHTAHRCVSTLQVDQQPTCCSVVVHQTLHQARLLHSHGQCHLQRSHCSAPVSRVCQGRGMLLLPLATQSHCF